MTQVVMVSLFFSPPSPSAAPSLEIQRFSECLHGLQAWWWHPIEANHPDDLHPTSLSLGERAILGHDEALEHLARHLPKIPRNVVRDRAVMRGSLSSEALRISSIHARSFALIGVPIISMIAFAAVSPTA